ncbi:MAG TPA: molybdopterin cofactor-binding domain-containing protein [Pseudorhodoferax sp.]|nr:molybdopterin cofactor-binding domain-containing protein [Pseudorhodoferax sp.]
MSGAPAAPALPAALQAHPRLGQWLRVRSDGDVEAFSGKVDIGQGISHALRLIVCAELQLPPARVHMVRASTAHSPDEAVTSGSLSVQHSGAALRCAAAFLRELSRGRLAQRCGVAPAAVHLTPQGFSAGAAPQSYAALSAPGDAALPVPANTAAPAALPQAWADSPRPEVADIVFGRFRYLQDLDFPGMCHGAVLRPAVLPARVQATLRAQRLDALRALDGIEQVVHDGLLVGVLARSELALARLHARWARWEQDASLWQTEATAPPMDGMAQWLCSQPLDTTTVCERVPPQTGPQALQQHQADYERPYLQHASIGLSCAIARWTGAQPALQVWSHSQAIYNLRRDLALALGLAPAAVEVAHVEGAGCYGHNGADDVAFDAAWLARHAGGRHVRVQWTRSAEMAHAPLGPAMLVRIRAALGPDGRLAQWEQQVWSQGHGTRPGRDRTPALLGAWQTAAPAAVPMAVNAALAAGGGSERNAEPPYALAGLRVLNHRVLAMPLRVSALRALGAHLNVFAAESFMDEMALQAGEDPLAFRLAHLTGEAPEHARARAVLQRAADLAGWDAGRPAHAEEGYGRGLAYARYKNTGAFCAVVAELVVAEAVHLRRLWIAADLGCVVHPDGARNQIEGGALQSASWTLHESAQWSDAGVLSNSWEHYPIARFTQQPRVELALLDRPALPSLGAGECAAGPVAAAIANAVADAVGVRMRSMPLSFERLLAQAQAA